MKAGIRLKLFAVSVALVAISLITAEFYLEAELERQLTERIREDLLVRTRLVAGSVSARATAAGDALADARIYDPLADELGRAAGVRVTLIRTDGTVAGDSEVEPAQLGALENHATRPEVAGADAADGGNSVRYSATLKERMLYAAVPVVARGKRIGTARLAMPLTSVETVLSGLHRTLALAALFALALAALISLTAANIFSRRVRELTEAAGKMASGNLAARARPRGTDEIAVLGQALDRLAISLSVSLESLRGERDVLSGILSSMHEGVLVVGTDRRIVLVNPALRAMLLIGPEAIGKNVLHVVRNAELNKLLEQTASGDTHEVELELAGLKPRRVLARAVTLREAPGGVLTVFVDVTELRRLESVRRDFVANASHELRSPLTTIRAAVETLRGVKGDPTAAARFIELIERNTERIENLVSDLLEIARLESSGLDLQIEALNLSAAANRILARHAAQAELKNIALVNAISGATHVNADARALDHVLGNLIDNALKYCPPGATVSISDRTEEALVRVLVTDTGPGIAPAHLPRLFERFYRVDAGRSRELGGTGLGLSIVKHLTEAMGGSVEVRSPSGAGTTFGFTLPRALREIETEGLKR